MVVTKRKQVPWEHSALTSKFYFVPPPPKTSTAEPQVPIPEVSVSPLSDRDFARIAEIATRKKLKLPAFKVAKAPTNLPDSLRRFVGVWVSDNGYEKTGRQLMVIVMQVNADVRAFGYHVVGSSTPLSDRRFGPSYFYSFIGTISGDQLSWRGDTVKVTATFTAHDTIRLSEVHPDGAVPRAIFNPAWRLVEVERAGVLPANK